MSDDRLTTSDHHADENYHEANHEGPIRTPKQLVIAVIFAFLVPISVIALLAAYVAADQKPAAGSDQLQPAQTAERIAPVGRVEVGEAPASAPAAATAAASAPADEGQAAAAAEAVAAAKQTAAAPAAGGAAAAGVAPALYTQACQACHAAGVAGAPKLGDKAAWAPRLAQGVDGLTQSVIKGKGVMPPRGGAAAASDAELKTVVAYMVEAVK